MDFSDVYNDPDDSDVLLKFVPDQAIGCRDGGCERDPVDCRTAKG